MNRRERVVSCIRSSSSTVLSLPMDVSRVILMARSLETTAEDLARFLSDRRSLSARVLKIANLPCYGRSGQIDSMSSAIILIGFQEITAIALASGIFSMLSRAAGNFAAELHRIWRHAVGVGLAMKPATRQVRTSANGFSILTGLLHDMGKIVFHICLPQEYPEVLRSHQEDTLSLHSVEREMLGIDHGEAAYLLLKQWDFPDSICMPVRYHHDLVRCPFEHFTDTMTLHLADYLTLRAGIGNSGNINPEISAEVVAAMNLSERQVEDLTRQVETLRSQVDLFLEALSERSKENRP